MALNLGELVAVISADDSRFHKTLDRVHTQLAAVWKVAGFIALRGAATTLGAALAPTVGLLAALPAAAAGAKVAMLSLGLALHGVGDALGDAVSGDMEKFEEGLAALAPAARPVVREIGKSMFGLRTQVQNAFFRPLQAQTKGLGALLRGPIQQGMTGVGKSLGGVAAKIVAVGREQGSIRALKGLFGGVGKAIDGVGAGVPALLHGIRDIIAAFTGGFGKAGRSAGSALAGVGHWLSRIAKGGQATSWFRTALATAKQLTRIGVNLGSTLANIFRNAGAGSGDFLTSLERITQKMSEWSGSAKGQDQIKNTFSLLNQVARDLGDILPLIVGPLGAVAKVLGDMPAPMRDVVAQGLAWTIVLSLITSKLSGAIVAVGKLGGGVGRFAGALRNPDSGLRKFAGKLGDAGKAAGRAGSATGRGLGRAAAATGRAALTIATAAGRIALSLTLTAARMVAAGAKMAISAAITAARVVAGWVVMGLQSMIQAARMAAAWIIAMGPVGWIVAAAIAAVALIIANWSTISNFVTKTLPAAFRAGFSWIVGIVRKGVQVGIIAPGNAILGAMRRVGSFFTSTLPRAVSSGVSRVVGFMRSLPGKIKSGIGNLGNLLLSAGEDIISGLWNGIKGAAGWIKSAISSLINSIIPGPVRKILGISSPSKVMKAIGAHTMQGLYLGLTGTDSKKVESASKKLASAIVKAFSGQNTRADDRLLSRLWANNSRLKTLADKRAAIFNQIRAAQQFAHSVMDSAMQFGSIASLEQGENGSSASDLGYKLKDRLYQIQAFTRNVAALKKKGLSKEVLRQILEAGPEQGGALARSLAAGGASAIKDINSTASQIAAASKSLGGTGADALYDAGKQAGRGFLTGLKAQENAIAQQMRRIAKSLTDAIKRALKIRSPSQVMAGIGGHTAAGLAIGMRNGVPLVDKAAAGLANAAVIDPAKARGGKGRGASSGGKSEVTVILDVRGGDATFKKMVKGWVRVDGGGSVQKAFT